MKEMVGGCCVCSDERGWDENPLVYCDGPSCNVAVHQACYGIVAVPSGPWFCRKCEAGERSGRVRCELCPSRDGAFKKTDNGNWAHVVCALYIPEVRFENVSTMEPILVSLIPQDRYNKTCYICEGQADSKKDVRAGIGACMECNKPGCKQHFHVTCAQALGLLCEEAGNMMDNVKYCGYCEYHYGKLKKSVHLKIIPPFKPIPSGNSTESPNSSPEKNGKGTAVTNNANSSADSVTTAPPGLGDSISKGMGGSKSSSKKSGHGRASSVSSASSNGSTNNSNNNTSMPRIQIQPSNLFTSSSGFSSYSTTVVNSNANAANTNPPPKNRSKSRSPSIDEIMPKAAKGSGISRKAHSFSGTSGRSIEDELITPKVEGESNRGGGGSKSNVNEPSPPSSSFTPATLSSKLKDLAAVSATVSMKEVISPPLLEKQPTSKYERNGSSSLGGGDSFSNSNANNTGTARIDKPPPDIVPHVTLTPIPMKPNDDPPKDRSSKSPGSFVPSFPRTADPMETEMATISLEKAPSPGKRIRLSLHNTAPPPLHQYDSDTESATEEWPEDAPGFSRSNSHGTTPLEENGASRRSNAELHGLPGTSPRRMTLAPIPHGAEMVQWDLTKSPSVSLERLPQGQPTVLVSPVGLKESQGQTFPFVQNSAYPQTDFPHRKRGPGRPSVKGVPGGREDEGRGKGPGGKRGRRGNSLTTNFARRDSGLANGGSALTTEDNVDGNSVKLDEDAGTNNGSARSGRQTTPTSRKAAAAPTPSVSVQSSPNLSRKASYEDAPPLTMSQLKAQMAATASPEKSASLAPHMFGNALNPASSMAQRMVDTLSQEMEAIGGGAETQLEGVATTPAPLIGIPFPGKSSLHSSTGGSKVNGIGSHLASTTLTKAQPQTLEELLERQWEQGSQFLMEQAQHLDISQLLSCLNQLKADNKALEDHVASLRQRKEQLTAINARLSMPLGSTNTLGLGLGFASSRQETPPMPTITVNTNKGSPMSIPAHTQAQLQHAQQQQQQQDVGLQGRYAQAHKYSNYDSGNHAYQQQHHRNSTGSVVTSQQQQQQLYGYAGQGASQQPAPGHHLQPPRENR